MPWEKRLERFTFDRNNPRWTPCRRKQPVPAKPSTKRPREIMTQIVGIVCKESILLASERQGTMAGSRRNFELQKIHLLHFDRAKARPGELISRSGALVAYAGASGPALRTIDFMQQTINAGARLDSKTAVVDIAVEAIREYRSEVLEFYNLPDLPEDRQDALFRKEENGFQFLIAHFYNYSPFLYSVASDSANITLHSRFATIGMGSDIATFFLSQIDASDMDWQTGIGLAVDTIEHVKGSDIYCGGPVDLGICIKGKRWPVQFPWHFTEKVAQRLKTKNDELRAIRKEGYGAVMAEIYREIDDKVNVELELLKMRAEETLKLQEMDEKQTMEKLNQDIKAAQDSGQLPPPINT